MSDNFIKNGVKVISGGTDNHLMLVDVKTSFGITGLIAEQTLDKICITVNKNTIPNETEKPSIASGIRIGSAAMTTRGFNDKDFTKVSNLIIKALRNYDNKKVLSECKKEVLELTKSHPMNF